MEKPRTCKQLLSVMQLKCLPPLPKGPAWGTCAPGGAAGEVVGSAEPVPTMGYDF